MMQPYQEQVIIDVAALVDRIDRLRAALETGRFDSSPEHAHLVEQLQVMESYADILVARIKLFKVTNNG